MASQDRWSPKTGGLTRHGWFINIETIVMEFLKMYIISPKHYFQLECCNTKPTQTTKKCKHWDRCCQLPKTNFLFIGVAEHEFCNHHFMRGNSIKFLLQCHFNFSLIITNNICISIIRNSSLMHLTNWKSNRFIIVTNQSTTSQTRRDHQLH